MVRLNEFNQIEQEPKLDYDLIDDMYFYAINDDDFYRKNYYPVMNKCKQTGDNEGVMPLIDSLINAYCTKYKIPKQLADQITTQDKTLLMQRMMDAEKENEE